MINEITTKEIIAFLSESKSFGGAGEASQNVKIIDVRPVEAYNGWQLKNEKRSGHIAGAKSLPAKWLNYIDWIEIVRHKEILPEHEIIVYGYSPEETQKVAERFEKSGYSKVLAYNQFVNGWTANPDLPMQKLERYKNLVSAEWVNELNSGRKPAEYDNDNFVLVHSHYRNREAYLSGHIPGAIDMDTLALEAPETWNRRSPEELKKTLEEHGITAATTVVLYGKYMDPDNNDEFPGSAAGDIGAIRNAFIMLYAGVRDVRILNGGFQSWQDAGFETSFTDEPKKQVADFGVSIPRKPELAVDTPEAKEMLASPTAELVCVRSWPEYIGEVSGYNYIRAKGRIPGAIFADCGSDAYHMENYRNVDHTTREFHEIAEIWEKNGITPDKHLAFYCGTGWRGSEAWFNAWLMGWPRVSVYDGGWFEWSNDPDNPYETGIPEENFTPGR
jgi:thiosulfate/3-mercaptopyruvate sulfurtransferase